MSARPQRKLTTAEWDAVHDTKLLNLHGALILGIVDPVPNPSPMPEEEGAWVREHVWTEAFHEIDRKYPFGFFRWSMCERGTCGNCLARRCDLCVHRQRGGPHVDDNTDWVHNRQGGIVARLILRPGDEPCVWWCRCPCPKTGEAPLRRGRQRGKGAPPEPSPSPPPPRPRRHTPATQATLFEQELMSQ